MLTPTLSPAAGLASATATKRFATRRVIRDTFIRNPGALPGPENVRNIMKSIGIEEFKPTGSFVDDSFEISKRLRRVSSGLGYLGSCATQLGNSGLAEKLFASSDELRTLSEALESLCADKTHADLPFELPPMPVPRFIPGTTVIEDLCGFAFALSNWEQECREICSAHGYTLRVMQDSWIIEPHEQPKEQTQLAPQPAATTELQAAER